MEYIPPQNRFSEHAASTLPLHDVLSEAASRMGIGFESATFSRLPGGFMNANFLVQAGSDKLVFRIYSTQQETADREREMSCVWCDRVQRFACRRFLPCSTSKLALLP